MTPAPAPVIILGATSGIARACADRWAERGLPLILVARDGDELARIGADLRVRRNASVDLIARDPADAAQQGALAEELRTRAPGGRCTILIAWGMLAPQERASADPALTAELIRVNFTSVATLGEQLAAWLAAGSVLCVIGSVAGDRGRASNYAYGAAKAGLHAWLSGLRHRLFRAGVAVVTIKPGFTATPMTAGMLKAGSPLVSSPDRVARSILRACDRRADEAYAPWFWWGIMAIIRSLPNALFKRSKL
jgi:decaprenylphospho-beta-D-erythro-pentofuranosid-2-ulose 2-reductase